MSFVSRGFAGRRRPHHLEGCRRGSTTSETASGPVGWSYASIPSRPVGLRH